MKRQMILKTCKRLMMSLAMAIAFKLAINAIANDPRVNKILETCKALKAYAESIEKNHSAACSHGAGYSLLGQLAQQVSTDLYYALKAFEGSGE